MFPKNFDNYVEVFGGAFWVYTNADNLYNKRIVYNDIDPMMYNLWLCIKDYKQFIDLLEELPIADKEKFKESREKVKEFINEEVVINEADFNIIEPFVYWQTHSFSGDINGGMSKVNNHIPMLNRLKRPNIQKKIDEIEVWNLSYERIIEKFDSRETLFYVDPPYFGREHFYGFHKFRIEDHVTLSEILKKIRGKFILSYYRKPEIEKMYSENDFLYMEKDYKRSSSSVKKGSIKQDATELLILNYDSKEEKDFLVNQIFT